MKGYVRVIAVLAMLCSAGACRKSFTDAPSQTSTSNLIDSVKLVVNIDSGGGASLVPYPQQVITGCFPAPLYGDSIIYPQPTGGSDYVVGVVNNPGPGHYFSWPTGLSLDAGTGAINLSKSETGTRYAIGYVKDGTHDTCLSTLIVGGADYMDSVYVLQSGATIAFPYFDANATQPSDCSSQGPGGHCNFDLTNAATDQKIYIDKHTGEIDLAKTLLGDKNKPGAFGSTPVNGASVTASFQYTLKKKSNSATQQITIRIMYYDSMAQVDPDVLATVQERLLNILNGNLISFKFNPRPPLIIIVRR